MKVISVFGTRPEAIKMAPVIKALQANEAFESLVLVTAQHREMLDQVLDFFGIYNELIESGAVYLAGTSRERIVDKVKELLANDEANKKVYEFAIHRSNIDPSSPILRALKQEIR